jgi:hypothetical protein
MVIRPVSGEGAKKRSSADLKFENFANVSDSILECRPLMVRIVICPHDSDANASIRTGIRRPFVAGGGPSKTPLH